MSKQRRSTWRARTVWVCRNGERQRIQILAWTTGDPKRLPIEFFWEESASKEALEASGQSDRDRLQTVIPALLECQ